MTLSAFTRVFRLAMIAAFVVTLLLAATASANNVVLEPCAPGSSGNYGSWAGMNTSNAQWILEPRCPSELTLYAKSGMVLNGGGNALFAFPDITASHGTLSNVSFDFLGGSDPEDGLTQKIKACGPGTVGCGPAVSPIGSDIQTPEHHEMTLDNKLIPDGADVIRISGGCPGWETKPCTAGRALLIKNLKMTFEDNEKPSVFDTGPTPADLDPPQKMDYEGWNTGVRAFYVRLADSGVGVKRVEFNLREDDLPVGQSWPEGPFACGTSSYPSTFTPFLCSRTPHSVHTLDLPKDCSGGGCVQEGLNHLKVTAIDAAGNKSDPFERDFRVDTVKPVIGELVVTPDTPSDWSSSSFLGLSWVNMQEQGETATESGVRTARYTAYPLQGNRNNNQPVSGELSEEGVSAIPDLEPLPPGRWVIRLITVDGAGNESAPAYATALVDPTVPDAPKITPPSKIFSQADLWNHPSLKWTPPANSDEVISGICSYALRVDESEVSDPGQRGGIAGDSNSGELSSDLSQGVHYAHLRAISCSGVAGEIAHIKIVVDKIAPSLTLSDPGPTGWYSPQYSPVVTVDGGVEDGLKLSIAIDGAPDKFFAATASTKISLTNGTHTVSLRSRDALDNESPPQVFKLKYDGTPPEASFALPDPSAPALVLANARDNVSGMQQITAQYRRADENDWRWLSGANQLADAGVDSLTVAASFADDLLAAGRYELRIIAVDRAGNEVVSLSRSDGSAAALELPLRAAASISASFGRKTFKRQGSANNSTIVGYGKWARVSGVLRSVAGTPLAGRALEMYESVLGGPRKMVGSGTTGLDGSFGFKPPAGPSRRITIRFSGDEQNLPAETTVAILVKANITLSAKLKPADHGWRIEFSGRVASAGAVIPSTGKFVRVQFHSSGGWQSFPGDVFADQNGRFTYARNFPKPLSPTKLKFRAVVPAAADWPYELGRSAVVTKTLR